MVLFRESVVYYFSNESFFSGNFCLVTKRDESKFKIFRNIDLLTAVIYI